jgi:hypothetical protein
MRRVTDIGQALAKKSTLRVHIVPFFSDYAIDEITTRESATRRRSSPTG